MGKTNISYVDYVWNTACGCTPIASGCQFCWSERLHNQRHTAWYDHRWPSAPKQYRKPFDQVQLLHDRLEDPLHWRKPRTIFVNSVSDTFHKDVPFEFILRMFDVMVEAAQHRYLIFTKRWQRAAKFFGNERVNDHIHLYFSASTQEEMEAAWKYLEPIPAAVKGFSFEPLLESLCDIPPVDSCIVGCESGPNRRMCLEHWIEGVVSQRKRQKRAVYVKQIMIDGKAETDMSRFPADLRVRQI